MSYDQVVQALQAAGPLAYADVVVVTLRDNGLASYSTGQVRLQGDVLTTSGGAALRQLFSDRTLQLPAGLQPFSISSADSIGLDITDDPLLGPRAWFTLHSWGNDQYSVSLEPSGDMLVGLGPFEGAAPFSTEYVIAFPALHV